MAGGLTGWTNQKTIHTYVYVYVYCNQAVLFQNMDVHNRHNLAEFRDPNKNKRRNVGDMSAQDDQNTTSCTLYYYAADLCHS